MDECCEYYSTTEKSLISLRLAHYIRDKTEGQLQNGDIKFRTSTSKQTIVCNDCFIRCRLLNIKDIGVNPFISIYEYELVTKCTNDFCGECMGGVLLLK